jgi:hypothetical protein
VSVSGADQLSTRPQAVDVCWLEVKDKQAPCARTVDWAQWIVGWRHGGRLGGLMDGGREAGWIDGWREGDWVD